MEIEFEYEVKDEVLNQEFIAGMCGSKERSVTYELSALTEQARKNLLALSQIKINDYGMLIETPWNCGSPKNKTHIELQDIYIEKGSDGEIVSSTAQFDHAVLSLEEVESKLTKMDEQATAIAVEYNRRNEEYERLEEEYERLEEEALRLKAEQEALKVQAEEEKQVWIEQNGSERLQLAHSLGYECHRLYVLERAAIEAPDYILDLDNNAHWFEQRNPSLQSLKLEQGLRNQGKEVQIVWLIRYPDGSEPYEDDDDEEGDEGDDKCEALVIRKYLGHYNLIKVM
jgi:hypothetical protein